MHKVLVAVTVSTALLTLVGSAEAHNGQCGRSHRTHWVCRSVVAKPAPNQDGPSKAQVIKESTDKLAAAIDAANKAAAERIAKAIEEANRDAAKKIADALEDINKTANDRIAKAIEAINTDAAK
jgi:hypothetical protein